MLESSKSYIILLIKDVHTVFCYYHICSSTIDQFEKLHGPNSWSSSKPLLKVFYVENGISQLKQTIHIDPFANNWYINIPEDDRDVYIEYGRIYNDSNYEPILLSNNITTPRDHQSGDTNLYYINIDIDKSPLQEDIKKNINDPRNPELEFIENINISQNSFIEEYMDKIDITNTVSSS